MSYFGVPMKTLFPPLIARHYFSPGAIPMSGFGADPAPIDPTQTPWWQQAVNWAQQNMPSGPATPTVPTDPTVPDPTQPQPAPAPTPAPGVAPPTAATSSANTLLVAGSIALVGVIGLVFLLKES